MGSTPLVSVIIVNINGRHHLAKCLPAVTRLDYDNYEVIVVDNDSLDGSPAYIAQHFPSVRVIESSTNLGYAGANNLGFLLARGDYLAVLNPDTIVEDRWLSELVKALEANPNAGLATSKIFMMDDPSRINACGNQITVSGITYCRGVGSPAIEFAAEEDVTAVSGAAFIIRRSVLEEVGPFDQNFFTYLEETDLSLRAMLAGYKCLYVPTSKVYHKYNFELRFSEQKCFHIEKNRYFMLAKSFQPRTLVLISPILLFTELLVWGYLTLKGPRFMRQKLLSYLWLWHNRGTIKATHARTQKTRRLSDKALFQKLTPQIQFEQMAKGAQAKFLYGLTAPIFSGLSKLSLKFV